jgi:hypothetical protein
MSVDQLKALAPTFAPKQPSKSSTADAKAALLGAAAPTVGGNAGGLETTNFSGQASALDRAMGLTAGLPLVEHSENISLFRAPRRK